MDFATALAVAIFLTVLANGALQARLLRDMVNALPKMDATLAEIHAGNRVNQELARVTLKTAQTTLVSVGKGGMRRFLKIPWHLFSPSP